MSLDGDSIQKTSSFVRKSKKPTDVIHQVESLKGEPKQTGVAMTTTRKASFVRRPTIQLALQNNLIQFN